MVASLKIIKKSNQKIIRKTGQDWSRLFLDHLLFDNFKINFLIILSEATPNSVKRKYVLSEATKKGGQRLR